MSGDAVGALVKFRDKHDLNFPLVSDTEHETLAAYGVWKQKSSWERNSWASSVPPASSILKAG